MFLYPVEEKTVVHDIDVPLGFRVKTRPVTNECGFCEWQTNLLPSFRVWFNGVFFFASVKRRPVLPALPFQKYESEYLEELLLERCVVSPVKVSGCPSVPRILHTSMQRQGRPAGPTSLCFMAPTCPTLLSQAALAASLPHTLCHCCALATQ